MVEEGLEHNHITVKVDRVEKIWVVSEDILKVNRGKWGHIIML